MWTPWALKQKEINPAVNLCIHFFIVVTDLAYMSYECEAPENEFEKERRKSLR